MKELINKFKKLDQTKRIVILFITISFVFIGSFSIYNGISGNYQKENTVQVTQTKEKKDKNTKKNKEEDKQDNKEETNTQQEEVNEQKEENTSQENTSNRDVSAKQETKKEMSANTNQSTTVSSNAESKTKEESNSNQTTNTTSNNDTSSDTNTSQSQTNSKITVSVQVIGMGDTMMASTMNVDKNSNALSVLKELASKNGKEVVGDDNYGDHYIIGIGGLYAKQHGAGSGWMYSVNGVTPMKAAINYNLKDGDSVKWYYVNYN